MNTQGLTKEKFLGLELNFQRITLYSMYSLSILVPLIIGKPQILVGSFVNFLISYSTLSYGVKKTTPILFLPSITATLTGLLFGGATSLLWFVMPIIILSNYLLSFFVSKRSLYLKVLGIAIKGIFIFIGYFLLNKLFGLPEILLASVPMQFVTATIGLSLALILFRFSEE